LYCPRLGGIPHRIEPQRMQHLDSIRQTRRSAQQRCHDLEVDGGSVLSMNVRFRSNDAYKAAFMNMFALVQLQQKIAARISELSGREIRVGRYCHMADSYHGALEKRTFAQRTMRYADVREMMEEARPVLLEKARKMGR
jgi:hypothetical protein